MTGARLGAPGWAWALLAAAVIACTESPSDAAVREIERLAPSARPAACAGASPHAKAFAAALVKDERAAGGVENPRSRRLAIGYDCLHAEAGPVLSRLSAAAGDAITPFYEAAATGCPLGDARRPPACGALDGLAAVGTEKAREALARLAARRDAPIEVWLGAQLRLWKLRGDAPVAAIREALAAASEPAGRAALVAVLARRGADPAAIELLRSALAAEKDRSVRAQLNAALVRATHPGDCVYLDDGRAQGDRCLYRCEGGQLRSMARPKDVECPPSFSPAAAR